MDIQEDDTHLEQEMIHNTTPTSGTKSRMDIQEDEQVYTKIKTLLKEQINPQHESNPEKEIM